jgi:replicative DNA helicase
LLNGTAHESPSGFYESHTEAVEAQLLEEEVARIPDPAHDLDAEAAVLSAVILDEGALAKVSELRPEHFYSEAHRQIFQACAALAADSKPVDAVTVATWLRERGRLEQAGGLPYLSQVLNAAPAVANVASYGEVVRRCAHRRRLVEQLEVALARARDGDDVGEIHLGAEDAARPTSPLDVLARWRKEGPLAHESTGLAQIDDLTGGGPVYGTRWYLAGAPDAGKTALLAQIAHTWATRGVYVGLLAVDEEDGDLVTRFVQRAVPLDRGRPRFTRRDCEDRPEHVLDEMSAALADVDSHVLFFGEGWTIEASARALYHHASNHSRGGTVRCALLVDSIQMVTCEAGLRAKDPSPRELVTANVRALRAVASRYWLISMATSEMNRGAYRTIDAAEMSSDLASGKESGAIEYSARVQLTLRSVKDHGDLIQVRAAKNKHGASYPRPEGEFFLRIDRATQRIESAEAPEQSDTESQKANRVDAKVQADATTILKIVATNPGIGSRKIRDKSRLGPPAVGRAIELLLDDGRVENRPTQHGTREDPHYFAVAAEATQEAAQ